MLSSTLCKALWTENDTTVKHTISKLPPHLKKIKQSIITCVLFLLIYIFVFIFNEIYDTVSYYNQIYMFGYVFCGLLRFSNLHQYNIKKIKIRHDNTQLWDMCLHIDVVWDGVILR